MEQSSRRLKGFIVCVALLASGIGLRLYQVQVHQSDALRARARSQHQRRVVVHPPRGHILDRHGRELAVSLETRSLFAHPGRLERSDHAALLLSPALAVPRDELLGRLRSDKPFVYLRRFLEPEQVLELQQLGLPIGDTEPLGFLSESKRYYPSGTLGLHVVGYATIDGEGVEGIERQFDEQLRGDPSVYVVTQDARQGRLRRLARRPERQPQDVILTLDLILQHVVERELDRAMAQTGAAAASAILMDPANGQVLALANRPSADPKQYGKARPEARVNRALSHVYEPGSTFKIVPLAAALELGRIAPGQQFDCERGLLRLGDRRIRDSSPNSWMTTGEILQKSSNIGMVKIARTMTEHELYDAVRRFGFGRPTGIELPGEPSGLLRPVRDWNAYSYASLAFGHEIAVTALQMISALAVIANDGVRVPPRVVLGLRHETRLERLPEPAPERVISSRTARLLGIMLQDVVTGGTGTRASVPGYHLAGKTGTAQKVVAGSYSSTEFMASFGGFGPLRSPRLVGLVVLDSPRGPLHQGGEIAAPVFRRIMTDALRHLRVTPDEDLLPPPAARDRKDVARLTSRLSTRPGTVPDLSGMSLRGAVSQLASRGYQAELVGRGFVVEQQPSPGSVVERGEICRVVLKEGEPGTAVEGTRR